MENKPLVSIISPVYNHEKYIGQCIKSVLAQTFTNWEMIIIDDCSTDNTESIIKKFNDSRIKYVKHSYNYGKERLIKICNEVLSISKGEFITTLEGDDYWPENRLYSQINIFKNSKIVLCHGLGIAIKNKNHIMNNYILKFSKNIRENNPIGNALKIFLSGLNLLAQSIMVKKDSLLKIGGFKQVPSLYLINYPTYPTYMEFSFSGQFGFISNILVYKRKSHNYIASVYEENIRLGTAEYSRIFIVNHINEIKKLPVKLGNYVKYLDSYLYTTKK